MSVIFLIFVKNTNMKEITERHCKHCNSVKPIQQFTKDRHAKSGYTYTCTKCRGIQHREYYKNNPEKQKIKNDKQKENRKKFYNTPEGIISSRKAHLKKMYNITLEEYDILLEKQNGVCAICFGKETSYRNEVLSVDHNHETGKIRGLLCNTCNRAIGLLKDDPKLLINAVNYLTKNV